MSDGLCVLEHDPERPAQQWIGLLCRKHRQRLDDDVTEIGLLIVDTQRIVDGGAPSEQTPKTRRIKAAEAPAPGDLQLVTLFDKRTHAWRIAPTLENTYGDDSEPQTAVLALIAANVCLVADERPLTETRTRLIIRANRPVGWQAYTVPMTLPDSVLAQLDLLRRHHDWIAAQDWVPVYLEELAEIRKALASAVADHPVTRVGTCHLTINGEKCAGPLLIENGDDIVQCRKCRNTWSDPRERATLAAG